jgi:heat shock protein HslJ
MNTIKILKLMVQKMIYVCLIVLVTSTISCNSSKQTTATANDTKAAVITGKYWRLAELNGQAVTPPADESANARMPHIIFKDDRVSGSGGCNTFNGTYAVSAPGRIKFSQIVATQKACFTGMETETELFRALEMTDNYTLSEDGKTLSLNRARMAPLARFEAVLMK